MHACTRGCLHACGNACVSLHGLMEGKQSAGCSAHRQVESHVCTPNLVGQPKGLWGRTLLLPRVVKAGLFMLSPGFPLPSNVP
jgi:hypothetical protein